MPRLVYVSAALADLADIAAYVAKSTEDRDIAVQFVGRLRAKCRELAALPFVVGRLRPEFGHELRSYAIGNYVLFFRVADDTFWVVAVIEGHRDVRAFLGSSKRL